MCFGVFSPVLLEFVMVFIMSIGICSFFMLGKNEHEKLVFLFFMLVFRFVPQAFMQVFFLLVSIKLVDFINFKLFHGLLYICDPLSAILCYSAKCI